MRALTPNPSVLFPLAGLALVVLVCWLVYAHQISNQRVRYETQAELAFQSLSRRLALAQASLDALVGLYQASDEMDAALFTPFSEELLQEYEFIDSLQYLAYVAHAEKQFLVEEMHELGFSQFEIRTLEHGIDLPANRDYYLVTSFVEPLTPSTAAQMGIDWLANERIRHSFYEVAGGNSIAMIPMPSGGLESRRLVMLKPTYFGRTIQSGVADRLEQISGVFIVVLDWDSLTQPPSDANKPLLPISFSLEFEGGEVFAASNSNLPFEKQRHFELGDNSFEVVARYELLATGRIYLTMALAGFVCAILFSIAVLELRSRYLLQREKNRVQSQLFKERERAEVTLRSIGDAVITTNIDNRINYMNPVAERMLDCSLAAAHGRLVTDLVKLEFLPFGDAIDDPVDFYIEMTQSNLRQTGMDVVLRIGEGSLAVDGNASPLLDSKGELIGSLLVLRDVSLEQELTSQLVYQASHDSLTGLINRAEFENRIKDALELSRQQDSHHALCYLDLDQFKLVNDTCGHAAGDELLKQVAGILQSLMQDENLVARLGGDEFGLLLHSCDQQQARSFAEKVRETLHDLHFKWEDKIFDVSASIGLVTISRMSGSLGDLMSAADLACFAAKDAGRNAVHVYRVDDEEISEKYTQMQWLPRIKEALKNDEFELAVQSVIPLKQAVAPPVINEFLLRWPQDNGQLISPGLFIPTAERYDLMRDLDWWVIEKALALIPELETVMGLPAGHMFTINLSGQSVGDPELANFIIGKLRQNAVNPESVCFEVTETVAIANFSVAVEFINRLRSLGCRFALDDFGSGLSSFGYLKRLPLDFLKIDGLFVRDMLEDPVDLAMVRTIYDVARVLKLQTIAEWVEDEPTLQALKSIGIDYAQGFHLSKPMLAREILNSKPKQVAHSN